MSYTEEMDKINKLEARVAELEAYCDQQSIQFNYFLRMMKIHFILSPRIPGTREHFEELKQLVADCEHSMVMWEIRNNDDGM